MMSKDILTRIPVLSPHLFTWENWGMPMMLNLGFGDTVDNILLAVNDYAIGYCDSMYLSVRPRTDQYAVMFKKENETFWFHIEKKYFTEEILIGDGSQKIMMATGDILFS